MKFFKKTISLFAIVAICMMCFINTSITVDAAEPTTYYIKYVASLDEWRFQRGTWAENQHHIALSSIYLEIEDGDSVVIDGPKGLVLEVKVRLNTLTVATPEISVVTAKGYDQVYVITDSTCAINGDVKTAEVYGNASVNFNNNVDTLKILSTTNDINANVNVLGTVKHLHGSCPDRVFYEYYNFEKDSLRISDGSVRTDASKYSTTPPATTTTPPSNNNSDEYDEVPKTGDSLFNPLWLVAIAAVCMVGAYKLK